jgi:ankyrin repeat protein
LSELKDILEYNPGINANWANEDEDEDEDDFTLLLQIVLALLAHPGIDVNQRDILDRTSFTLAFYEGNVEVVKVLLPRSSLLPDECSLESSLYIYVSPLIFISSPSWIIKLFSGCTVRSVLTYFSLYFSFSVD